MKNIKQILKELVVAFGGAKSTNEVEGKSISAVLEKIKDAVADKFSNAENEDEE